MNFRHMMLVLKREYLERLRSPGFIIGTIIGVIGIAGLSFLPALINLIDQQTTAKVVIVDPKDIVFPYIPQNTAQLPGVDDPGASDPSAALGAQGATNLQKPVIFSKADTIDENVLGRQVKDGKFTAYVLVRGENAMDATFALKANDRPSTLVTARTQLALTSAVLQGRIKESGLTPAQAAALFAQPKLKVEPLVGGKLTDERAVFQSQALVYVLLILLYITILMYGVQVAMGVVYEKNSRVMEVLITAVKPMELMLGKVLGVGALGLTQYVAWVLAGFVGLFITGVAAGNGGLSIDLALVPPATLVYFLIFFVLGYLVYAALYAALGSLVNRTEDVNSITMPLTILLVATYLLSFVGLGNPDGALVRWLAYVPFFTPMLMFIRVALGVFSLWEPLLAIVILIASIIFFTWVAAKIYRVGVLMYGKRPSIREMARLLRAA